MAESTENERFTPSITEVLQRRAESLALETAEEGASDVMGVLLFRLADEWYGVRVEDVREIYQEYDITPIPCVPGFILGVVNIRGEIISVTNLAALMRLGALTVDTESAPAIIVHNGEVTTAVVVDEIADIADVPRDSVEPPLSTMDKAQAEFIAGSLSIGSRLVGLVNVDRVLQPVGSD